MVNRAYLPEDQRLGIFMIELWKRCRLYDADRLGRTMCGRNCNGFTLINRNTRVATLPTQDGQELHLIRSKGEASCPTKPLQQYFDVLNLFGQASYEQVDGTTPVDLSKVRSLFESGLKTVTQNRHYRDDTVRKAPPPLTDSVACLSRHF